MTVKELIEDLMSVAEPDDEVKITVSGTSFHREELSGVYRNEYLFRDDIEDAPGEIDGIYSRPEHKLELKIGFWKGES